MASLDAGVRNTQLSGRASDLEMGARFPGLVRLALCFWKAGDVAAGIFL